MQGALLLNIEYLLLSHVVIGNGLDSWPLQGIIPLTGALRGISLHAKGTVLGTGEDSEQVPPAEGTAIPSGARGVQAGDAAGIDEEGGGGTLPQDNPPQVPCQKNLHG